MKQVSHVLILLIALLDISCTSTNTKWDDFCNKNYYAEFLSDEKMQELELDVIQKLNAANFQGTFAIKEDSLVFGWHEGELDTSNSLSIREAVTTNGFYAVYHRINHWTYFKKVAGFIDDSCGLMYVPEGSKLPIGVKVSQMLVDKGKTGKWYFVETKL
tara:strand:- start:2990 stop:3466 length:477 start_codon:yes stop_codon:yes gene_type:complete